MSLPAQTCLPGHKAALPHNLLGVILSIQVPLGSGAFMRHLLDAKNWEQKGSISALRDLTSSEGRVGQGTQGLMGSPRERGGGGMLPSLQKGAPALEHHEALPSDRTCPDLSFPICNLPHGAGLRRTSCM